MVRWQWALVAAGGDQAAQDRADSTGLLHGFVRDVDERGPWRKHRLRRGFCPFGPIPPAPFPARKGGSTRVGRSRLLGQDLLTGQSVPSFLSGRKVRGAVQISPDFLHYALYISADGRIGDA